MFWAGCARPKHSRPLLFEKLHQIRFSGYKLDYNWIMHIILTHEQADFDALASMLGAWLLNRQAYAILPRRMNRNAREFCTSYQHALPFIEARDLPAEPIESVILVDTQSLITLRGMNKNTHIFVVDHHPLRPGLPLDWKISFEPLAACSTFFVENLLRTSQQMDEIQATLLLLGIYEDSGSLSYASTTPRDVRAAAALLEQGASLRLASKFLNPPLSSDQQHLFDRLLSNSETITIHGQRVMVACADARSINDEISSVAHKLRDLLDPDGLFILVITPEGIRIVARSTSDHINVAEAASHFGGGGHNRAASALIRLPSSVSLEGASPVDELSAALETTHHELLRILPEIVRPPITVAQIMSQDPLLISPETTAEEAAQLMQRYGYEGYPVVDQGKVVGLLTRRAVDRSLSHKLNLIAYSLMESGTVTVQPQDTLEHLQRVMNSSGWGQIPVIDPENGMVVGIVTRTDLFKILTSAKGLPAERQNLSKKLDSALPPARLALLKAIAACASSHNLAVYIVGGFVRDLLLDRPSLDYDMVVEGDAIELAHSLTAQFGGKVVYHRRFGTSRWELTDIKPQLAHQLSSSVPLNPLDLPDSLDLITARIEFYDYPSALPTVERSSIKLDLHRRDFSINTLALRLDGNHYGELYDYWGGLHDLEVGRVRVLHSLSFVDDPTRMMRAVRFEQRFGFQIESRTQQLIVEALPLIKQVSGQRLHHELDLLLQEEHPARILARLEELGLLKAIHPDLGWKEEQSVVLESLLNPPPQDFWNLPQKIDHTPLNIALVYIGWLEPVDPEQLLLIFKRLRFSKDLQNAVLEAIRLHQELPILGSLELTQSVRALDEYGPLSVYAASRMNHSCELNAFLEKYVTSWRTLKPFTTGQKLMQMGVTPGPAYRTILDSLRAAWLKGEVQSKEEEEALLSRLLSIVTD